MKIITSELKNFRIFQRLRCSIVSKIFQYMREVSFKRGHIIYKEGDKNVDAIYFIKEGEFSVK